MERINEYDFQLNLEFEGGKNASLALTQLSSLFDKLETIDRHILYNIFPEAKIEYDLIDLEFGSILSWIKQKYTSIPDEYLQDILNPSSWLGHLLVYIKKRLIEASGNNEVEGKNDLEKLTRDINNKMKKLSPSGIMIFEVNNYFVLNSLNEISKNGQKLKGKEAYYYKSKAGNAVLKNTSNVNMSKILSELGSERIEQERVEILKLKAIDLLSDETKWKVIREGRSQDIKILDKEWLNAYRSRKIVIQPNDYLKIQLKVIYIADTNKKKPKILLEALKVYEVIPPEEMEDDKQENLF
jgi:hypothetical protein